MSEPFLAEIRIFGFDFAPRNWAKCDGQILPINQNQSLYSLLGTTYGGDGRTTFGLPALRGRTPIHTGQNGSSGGHQLGEKSGTESHPLSQAEIPSHTHTLSGSTTMGGSSSDPSGKVWGASGSPAYHALSQPTAMATDAVGTAGGNSPHNNMQPFLALSFCIAIVGTFPPQN